MKKLKVMDTKGRQSRLENFFTAAKKKTSTNAAKDAEKKTETKQAADATAVKKPKIDGK